MRSTSLAPTVRSTLMTCNSMAAFVAENLMIRRVYIVGCKYHPSYAQKVKEANHD